MATWIQDLHLALRGWLRSPLLLSVAVLTLALGVGAATVLFSFTYTLLLRPLPYEDPDRLALVWSGTDSRPQGPMSFPDIRDLDERNRSFEAVAPLRGSNMTLTGSEGQPERLRTLWVSSRLLPTLGLEPILGRAFEPRDDQPAAAPTALISHALWQNRFGGDRAILGSTIRLNAISYQVLGVLSPALASESLGWFETGDVWLPLGLFADELPVNERGAYPGLLTIARLRPGTDIHAARRDLADVSRQLAIEYPETNKDNRFGVELLRDNLVKDVRPAILTLLAAVGFLLLITCANLAGLLLARAATRPREMALRSVLGASRWRLVRQLLTENLVLAVLGGGAGLVAALWGLKVLPTVLPQDLPHLTEVRIHGWVVLFAAGVSILTGLLFGIVPALSSSRTSHQEAFAGAGGRSTSGRRSQRLRSLLVAAELALALVLLIGAQLMLQSVRGLSSIDTGFEAEGVLSARMNLPPNKYEGFERWAGFFDQVLGRVAALPGVEQADLTSLLPLTFGANRSRVIAQDSPPEDRDAEDLVAFFQLVGPNYFQALGIPVIQGRGFAAHDDLRLEAPAPVILNQGLARRLWPEGEPVLGKRVSFEIMGDEDSRQWREVVGVVGDVRQANLDGPAVINVYVPYTHPPIFFLDSQPTVALVVKTAGDPASLTPAVRRTIAELDPEQPVYRAETLEQILRRETAYSRMVSLLLTVFAVLALVQAVVGLYGVISYSVAQRRQELSVRLALGAQPSDLLRSVLVRAARLVLIGGILGLVLAFATTRLMASLLYGVEATDPSTFLLLAAVLMTVALISSLIPAWRATRVDPVNALRTEQ